MQQRWYLASGAYYLCLLFTMMPHESSGSDQQIQLYDTITASSVSFPLMLSLLGQAHKRTGWSDIAVNQKSQPLDFQLPEA